MTDVSDLRTAYADWSDRLEAEAQTRRQAALAKLTDAEDVRAWAADLCVWWRDAVGPLPLPERSRSPEPAGAVQCDGYRVERWLFESLPGTWAAANLYVPARPNPQGLAIWGPARPLCRGQGQEGLPADGRLHGLARRACAGLRPSRGR